MAKVVNNSDTLPPLAFLPNGCRTFYNTCAFDSFTQSILALTEYKPFMSLFETKEGNFKSLILSLRKNDLIEADLFRYKLLCELYPEVNNCNCNIYTISNNLFGKQYFPNQTLDYECVTCSYSQQQIRYAIDIDYKILKQKNGIKNLNNCITNLSCKKCPKCDTPMSFKTTFSPILTIDVQLLTDDYKASTINCSLAIIPKEIFLEGKEYILQSVLDYIPGHYICFLKRINNEWEIYNDCKSQVGFVNRRLSQTVHPHVVVYLDKNYT